MTPNRKALSCLIEGDLLLIEGLVLGEGGHAGGVLSLLPVGAVLLTVAAQVNLPSAKEH